MVSMRFSFLLLRGPWQALGLELESDFACFDRQRLAQASLLACLRASPAPCDLFFVDSPLNIFPLF